MISTPVLRSLIAAPSRRRVAVSPLLLVRYAEKRGLENIYVSAADEIRVILHEEGEHEHTDMHSVIIGIGRHNDVVVAQIVEVVFDAKGWTRRLSSSFSATFLRLSL